MVLKLPKNSVQEKLYVPYPYAYRSFYTDEDKINGLDAGADDYVTKPFSTDVLLATHPRASCAVPNLDGVSTSRPQAYVWRPYARYSKTARHVLKGKPTKAAQQRARSLLFASSGTPRECSAVVAWLTQKVWKEDYLSTSRTIDVHIRRLRSVLDETSDYDYIHTVHGMGYRFDPVKKDLLLMRFLNNQERSSNSNSNKPWRFWLAGSYFAIVLVFVVCWMVFVFSPVNTQIIQQQTNTLTITAKAYAEAIENTDNLNGLVTDATENSD